MTTNRAALISAAERTVLETIAKLHEGKTTAHWLWVALSRVAAGDPVDEVMRDYGWVRKA